MNPTFAKLLGLGTNLPGEPVGNDHFVAYLDTSDEWIQERTGIRTRYFAPKGTLACDLAVPAATAALANAKLTATDIDGIIFATTTPDHLMPSTACLLQQRLNITGSMAFDVQAACSGFVYALTVATAMIENGSAKRILVVASEIYSRVLNWQDRSSCILFGDGAAAAVVGASSEPGVMAVDLHADGEHASIIEVTGHIADNRVRGSSTFRMDGGAVYKLAVKAMEESSRKVCAKAGIEPTSVDWLVVHQANLRIINAVAKRLEVADANVLRTVVDHANTSAASIPLALASVWEQVKPGDKLLLTAAGAGLTWGSVLLTA